MVTLGLRAALLLSILWPALGAAGPLFDLEVKQRTAEYGQPLRLTLRTNQEQPSLESIDLSTLDRDFVVDTPSEVMEDHRAGGQYWRIRLYPRHPGALVIPALEFLGHRTMPIPVNVQPARDPDTHFLIRVSSKLPNASVWVNQPLKVIVSIETDDAYARIEMEKPWQETVKAEVLPPRRSKNRNHGPSRIIYETGWVLTPVVDGQLSVQLPPVKIRKDGVVTHRFYPPRLLLQVRALPSFVPPTMPVGIQSLDVALPKQVLFMKGETYSIVLKISDDAVPGRKPVGILRQFRSTASIRYLEPGKVSEVAYRLPFVPKAVGLLSLPKVRLQYFDPSTGKIDTREQVVGSIWAIDAWIKYALIAGSLALGLVVLRIGFKWARRKWQMFSHYREALRQFQQARNTEMLKSGLQEIARAESWPVNLTLREWQKYWRTHFPRSIPPEKALWLLQGQRYGNRDMDFPWVRQQLAGICYGRQPLLRLLAIRSESSQPVESEGQREQ